MSLRIHNTLSRQLDLFTPLEAGHVRMYVCGMTVYDLCHLGHARAMVAFDVVQRWLKASDLRVTYVRNVTDIDDKVLQNAAGTSEEWWALAWAVCFIFIVFTRIIKRKRGGGSQPLVTSPSHTL